MYCLFMAIGNVTINIIDKYSAIPHISSIAAIEISVEREGDRNEILHLAH